MLFYGNNSGVIDQFKKIIWYKNLESVLMPAQILMEKIELKSV